MADRFQIWKHLNTGNVALIQITTVTANITERGWKQNFLFQLPEINTLTLDCVLHI